MEFNNNSYKRVGTGEFGANIPVLLSSDRVNAEISEDFTLPEYMPEIRRVLRVDAMATSPSRYLAATSLKLSGSIEYCIIYVGTDGKIHSATQSDDYEMSAPFAEGVERDPECEISAFADTRVDGVLCKVTGARKINVKSHLSSYVKVIGSRWEGAGADIPDEPHVEKLMKTVEYYSERLGENSEMEAVDELELSGGDRYISSDCRVFVEDAVARDGYAEVRGNVIMNHLIEKERGGVYEITRRIPFGETVEIDGLESGADVTAFGKCNAIIKNKSDDDGEGDGALSVNAHILIFARGYNKHEMKYAADAFSTQYESEAECADFDLPVLYSCANKNLTLMESVDVEEVLGASEGEGREVACVAARASADGVALSESGKYVINGKCAFYVILARDGEEDMEYSSSTLEVPFRYECADGGEMPDAADIFVEAIEPRVKCDGENASVGCEILISYGFCGKNHVECVKGCRMGDEKKRRGAGYTVCYPDSSDTLWSVSKKYGASVAATARDNGLSSVDSPDYALSADGIKYLIV